MSPIVIISLIIGLLVLGGMIFAVFYQIKKTDPKNIDSSIDKNIKTCQEFLQFETIKDSMIHLGGHQYRALIECDSINYDLKTAEEKEIIEAAYQRFLNSISFPITIYIQTKTIDNTKMLANLEKDILKTLQKYPNLNEYANVFYSEMQVLQETTGNTKQKKKYIIINYDEASLLSNSNDDEKYEYAGKEMHNRVGMLIDGLRAVGITSRVLNTKSISEIVFSAYHKDNYTLAEHLTNGEYTTLFIDGENKLEKMKNENRLDLILYETESKLKNEVVDEGTSNEAKEKARVAINEIEQIRKVLKRKDNVKIDKSKEKIYF